MLVVCIILFLQFAGITEGFYSLESGSRTSNVLKSNSTIHSECGVGYKSIIYNVSLTGWTNIEHVMTQMVGFLNYLCNLKQSCVIYGSKVNETYQKYTHDLWEIQVDILCVRSTNIIRNCHHDSVIVGTGVMASYGYPYYSGNASDCVVRIRAEGPVQLTVATCGRISVHNVDGQLCTGRGPNTARISVVNSTIIISYELQSYGYSGFLFIYQAESKDVGTMSSYTTTNSGKTDDRNQNLWWIVLTVLFITVGGCVIAAAIYLIKQRSTESRRGVVTPDDHEYDYITTDELLDLPVTSPEESVARKADVVNQTYFITGFHVTNNELSNDVCSQCIPENNDVNSRIYHVLDPSAVKFTTDGDSN